MREDDSNVYINLAPRGSNLCIFFSKIRVWGPPQTDKGVDRRRFVWFGGSLSKGSKSIFAQFVHSILVAGGAALVANLIAAAPKSQKRFNIIVGKHFSTGVPRGIPIALRLIPCGTQCNRLANKPDSGGVDLTGRPTQKEVAPKKDTRFPS